MSSHRISSTAPRISVVMPCYNGAAHLNVSIASALGQSFGDIELIVVDDGSTDGSAAILAGVSDPRIRVLTQRNNGVCAARNAGVAIARGEFVAFLDADDSWHPDCLQELHQALADSAAAIAYCGWQNVGLSGPRGEPYVPPDLEGADKLSKLFDNCQWPIHACLTRRSAIEAAGAFDKRFKTSEDYLLWLKIGKSHGIVRVPLVLACYHFHGGSQATGNKAQVAINHFHAQRAFIAEFPEDARRIPPDALRASMEGRLLQRALECHWKRDLVHARPIFRTLLREARGGWRCWRHGLPAFLPVSMHAALLRRADSGAQGRG